MEENKDAVMEDMFDESLPFTREEWNRISFKVKMFIQDLEEGFHNFDFFYLEGEELDAILKILKMSCFDMRRLKIEFGFGDKERVMEMFECLEKQATLEKLETFTIHMDEKMGRKMLNLLNKSPNLKELGLNFSGPDKEKLLIMIAENLEKNKTVEKLCFSDFESTKNVCETIASLIEKNCGVKELTLAVCNEDSSIIFEAIEKNKTLKSLVLKNSYYRLRTNFSLKENRTLERLSLEGFALHSAFLKNLTSFITLNTLLTHLHLERCSLASPASATHFSTLVDTIFEVNVIETLNLNGFDLGQSFYEKMGKFLETNTSLKELYLRSESGSICKPIDPIVLAMKKNKTLLKLDLLFSKGNSPQLTGEILEGNNTLEELQVSFQNLGIHTLKLFKSLKTNRSLRFLNCSGNMFDSGNVLVFESKPEIAEALRNNSTLSALKMRKNNISMQDMREIIECLYSNVTLTEVDISNNPVTEDVYKLICSLLSFNSTLKSLVAEFDVRATPVQVGLIIEALKKNASLTNLKISFDHCVKIDCKREIIKELSDNKKKHERDNKVKVMMLILQRRGDGNIVNRVPRRLLIHLLSFLGKIKRVRLLMREKRKKEAQQSQKQHLQEEDEGIEQEGREKKKQKTK